MSSVGAAGRCLVDRECLIGAPVRLVAGIDVGETPTEGGIEVGLGTMLRSEVDEFILEGPGEAIEPLLLVMMGWSALSA